MSHELHNLVTKIENACDPEIYEVADTEHLVRLAVAEYVVAQNGLVASARVVDPTSVQKVIDRHISENISAANPQSWFANVAAKIADFLELAYEGTTNNESSDYVDLLPIGHPRNIKNLGLTASARMQAVAEWVAADPRITSDLGRQAVYNAYRAKPESLEATYANAKIQALAASGVLPADFAYEAIVASFKNMSFAERSARSKALAAVRRRDRWKQFANEFGRLRGFFSKGDGTMFSATGKIAGAVPGENKYYVEYDGSDPDIPAGIYIQDAGMSENVRATLSKRALKNAPNLRKSVAEFDKRDQSSAVDLKEFLATKVDSPGDWTKNEDGSFSSKTGNKVKEVDSLPEGDYYFEGVGENNEQDLGEPLFEIRDSNDELIGVAQDWNGIQKIALTKDKMKEKAEKKAPEINDQTFAEALAGLNDETNWDDPDTEPSYESPNGVLSVSFSADADTDGEGGMKDMSGWSASLDPDGEDIQIASWRGGPDDDMGDIMDRVEAGYKEYKAKKAGEAAPAKPADQGGLKNLSDEEIQKKAEAEAQADAAPARTDGKIGRFVPGRSARDEADSRGLDYTGKLVYNEDYPGKKPEAKTTEKSKPSYLDQKPKQYRSTLEKDSLGYSTGVDDDGFVEVRKSEDGGYEVNHGFTYLHDENYDEVQFDEGSKNFPTEKEALDFANEKLAYYNSWRVNEDAANKTVYGEPGLGQDLPEAEAPAKPAKPLSEKQMEPASPKQYALLKEFQEERDGIDANQNQAINDALEKQNLSKAQMASLFGDLQKKPFKPEVDPTKPSDRMINSLRDYLTNKELTPDEINSALDELEAGLDRAGVEKLLAKLRRRPDKAKEERLGQDIPSDLVLTPQGLANGFNFDTLKDGKTWSADASGFNPLNVEVTEYNGKWFTTERSGGNMETGFTRESEKQHATAQEAFEYAAEVAGRSWDQDLYDDLSNNWGDDEDEIGFAEEEGLGQEADSTEEGLSVDLSNYEKKDTIFDRLIPGDLIPEYYPIRGTEDWLLRNRAQDPNFEMAPKDEIVARYRTNDPKKVGFKVRDLETGKERYFEVTRASRIYDIYRLPVEPKDSEQGLGQAAPSTKMAEDATDAQYNYVSSMLNGKEVPEELAAAAKQAIEDRNLSKAQVGEIIGKMRDLPNKEGYDPNAPTERMIESVKRNIVAKGLSQEDQDAILQDLPNMDKATMSELIGRLKAMDDVNVQEQGLSQSNDQGPYYDSNSISDLQDRVNKLKGEEGISQFISDDEYTSVDLNSVSDALTLAADLNAVSYRMEPTSPEGKALEADLKRASEDIIKSVEEKLGPVEAAKYDIADGSTNKFDDIFDEVDTFMSYYYPSDTDAIYEELSDGGSIGDVRGGGWEGSVRQNEDGSWLGSVGSPGRDSDSYSETFETSEDAASWVAGSLEQENKYLPDFDVRLFSDGSRADLDSLIEEYGNDPEVLANKLAGVVNWFRGTNRGMGENIAGDLSDYLDRLNEIIASQKKSDEQGLGQESPKA